MARRWIDDGHEATVFATESGLRLTIVCAGLPDRKCGLTPERRADIDPLDPDDTCWLGRYVDAIQGDGYDVFESMWLGSAVELPSRIRWRPDWYAATELDPAYESPRFTGPP